MVSPPFDRFPVNGPSTPETPASEAVAGVLAMTQYPPAGMMVPLANV